jgi:O-acetylhomoserine (thiol)-lyase
MRKGRGLKEKIAGEAERLGMNLPGFADMDRYRYARYHHLLRKEMRYPCGVCTLVCPVGKDRNIYGGASVSGEGLYHTRDRGARRNFYLTRQRGDLS